MKIWRFYRWRLGRDGAWCAPPLLESPGQPQPVKRGEIAFSEEEMYLKLSGDMAEIVDPGKPWWVRLWRMAFRPRAMIRP